MRAWRPTTGPLAITGTLLLIAACQAPAAGAVDASATMVVEPTGQPAEMEEDGPRIQFRNLTLAGTITITAGEQQISGEISFAESEDITFGETAPEIVHVWGIATASLDDTSCEGPYALSAAPAAPGQGLGALLLRCEDGSVYAGDLRDFPEIGPDGFLATLTRESRGSWSAP